MKRRARIVLVVGLLAGAGCGALIGTGWVPPAVGVALAIGIAIGVGWQIAVSRRG